VHLVGIYYMNDRSPPPSVEVKIERRYNSIPPTQYKCS